MPTHKMQAFAIAKCLYLHIYIAAHRADYLYCHTLTPNERGQLSCGYFVREGICEPSPFLQMIQVHLQF